MEVGVVAEEHKAKGYYRRQNTKQQAGGLVRFLLSEKEGDRQQKTDENKASDKGKGKVYSANAFSVLPRMALVCAVSIRIRIARKSTSVRSAA